MNPTKRNLTSPLILIPPLNKSPSRTGFLSNHGGRLKLFSLRLPFTYYARGFVVIWEST